MSREDHVQQNHLGPYPWPSELCSLGNKTGKEWSLPALPCDSWETIAHPFRTKSLILGQVPPDELKQEGISPSLVPTLAPYTRLWSTSHSIVITCFYACFYALWVLEYGKCVLCILVSPTSTTLSGRVSIQYLLIYCSIVWTRKKEIETSLSAIIWKLPKLTGV